MTLARAAKMAVRCAQCDARSAAEIERIEGLAANDHDLLKTKHAITVEAWEAKIAVLRGRLGAAEAFWRSPLFVAAVSVVVTVGGILAARYLVITTQPEI